MTDQHPTKLFSIGEAVDRLQAVYPEVTHSSLRFLQRRGLVTPLATPGGHRKYRERDLHRIRMIKAWQDERLSLDEIGARLAQLDAMPPAGERWPRFLEFALAGRAADAGAVVLGADDVGVPLVETFEEVLRPALHEVGRLWAAGQLRVDQEHEVSELCRDLVSELTLRHMRAAATGRIVLAAAVEGEWHDIGLRMVCGLLREQGVAVHFLGANLPARLLLESVLFRRPDMLLLSITIDRHRASLAEVVRGMRPTAGAGEFPRLVVGGASSGAALDIVGPHDLVIPPDASLEGVIDELATVLAPG